MSLVGFKITNHPQQVGKRGASDTVDERITPQWLFDKLDEEFRFTVDVAANASNTKCGRWYDLETDGLAQAWSGESVWCNPPYSNIAAWVAKAEAEMAAGCPSVVMLLPANRTEQRWWQDHIEPHRDHKGRIETRFLRSRINFGVPGNEAAKFNSSPPFGLCVVVFSETASSISAPAVEWRCFHCGQVFTDRVAAEAHFGKSANIDPVCLSSVKKMREHVLASLNAERAP